MIDGHGNGSDIDGDVDYICILFENYYHVSLEKAQRMLGRVAIETLSHELQQLFVNNAQIAFAMVTKKYQEKYGRPLNITDTGYKSLESLLTKVLPGVKVCAVVFIDYFFDFHLFFYSSFLVFLFLHNLCI